MKRFFATMLISMMTFVCTIAQLNIWYNGAVVYQRNYSLIDSITFSIQSSTPSIDLTDNLPTKVENLIGMQDNEIRSALQAEGYIIKEEYTTNEELFLTFVNDNQDTIKCAFRQSNLLTDVNAIMYFPSNNSPLEIYKEWSVTAYNLVTWQNWNGYIQESPQSNTQDFSGRTLFISVLNSISYANYVAERYIFARDNYASLSCKKGALISRMEYARYRHLDVMPVAINLPDTIYVVPGGSINIPYTIQPHGASLSYITATIEDSSIANVVGERILGKSGGYSVMHVTCGSIQKSVVVACLNPLENGVYVIGPATAVEDFNSANRDLAHMAAGINEVTKTKRAGMYEKYIALEANKDFQLVFREGKTEIRYGAELAPSDTLEGSDVPQIQVYQGVIAENAKMQVPVSGLYHIILDLNQEGDLKDKLIMVVPVEWGVRGAMNGWGYTAMTTPEFNKTSMTFVLDEALVKDAGTFKFAHSAGWKFQLDQAGLVKAENNLGSDATEDGGAYKSLLPGGKNLPIERGYWKIELKWTLEGGALEKSFVYTPTKTKDYTPAYEHLYMIGTDFGNWDWTSEGIVELAPVNEGDGGRGEGQFWCVRYFKADNGFKFSAEKNWDAPFASRATMSEDAVAVTYDSDGNVHVPADGFYMVHIDMKNDKMTIEEPAVYGIGDAFGAWDKEMAAAKFVANGQVMEVTTSAAGNLRMYATSSLTDSDWWTREFNIIGGKIVYRGKGGDQEAVPVAANKKITLDFNAGTGTIQ